MSCFGKRLDGPGGRRKSVRQSACAVGSAVTLDGARSIVVEDICSEGAKIRGRRLPTIGKPILLWVDDLDVLGTIVWSRFEERGIAFDEAPDTAVAKRTAS